MLARLLRRHGLDWNRKDDKKVVARRERDRPRRPRIESLETRWLLSGNKSTDVYPMGEVHLPAVAAAVVLHPVARPAAIGATGREGGSKPPGPHDTAAKPDGRVGRRRDVHRGSDRQSEAVRSLASQREPSRVVEKHPGQHLDDSGSQAGTRRWWERIPGEVQQFAGRQASQVAVLTVRADVSPTITSQPTAQSIAAGASASLRTAADGFPQPTVPWQVSRDGGKSWANIVGAAYDLHSGGRPRDCRWR